ncbi:elongation factor P hydroxylase [Photobacterium leiognathi]|uniref:elongation factor P hydroxylase n=1 Tax=Photobacterium leiognathi TaxID=553611 RepID=UPI002980D33C|nr:elongation factor P hydroxylase [Photobacterium leiognathi]
MRHDYNDLIVIFNGLFLESLNTELLLGGDEPIYLPASSECEHNQIIFARGYFASAMHELAHWCIAGFERRKLEDYGYWYEPDGRSEAVQAAFEKVEIKPQAIEWILSASCGFKFQVSCDNLSGDCEPDRVAFTLKVREQVLTYLECGIPERAKMLSDAFRAFYGIKPLTEQDFIQPVRYNEMCCV